MKEATIEQLTQDVNGLLAAAQRERLLVTRDGKPFALVVGIENKDEEDLQLESSPEFWQMIAERRRRPTVRLEDVEALLFPESGE